MPVIIGTYNMSFAGDKFPGSMPSYPSEYSFHLRDTAHLRGFWNNAKNHLMKFINEKKPLAVGLQEMNVKELEPDFKADFKVDCKADDGGINGIKRALPSNYKIISGHVSTNDAALSIIYNTTKLTVEKKHTVDNPEQSGRPLFMVLMKPTFTTDENPRRTLLVNMHGAQDPNLGGFEDDFNKYMLAKNRAFLQEQVEKFLTGKDGFIKPAAIYIMGDFNDRYDAIKDFNIKDATVTYTGDSPNACCHNWDSMGNAKNRINILKTNNQSGTSQPTNSTGEPSKQPPAVAEEAEAARVAEEARQKAEEAEAEAAKAARQKAEETKAEEEKKAKIAKAQAKAQQRVPPNTTSQNKQQDDNSSDSDCESDSDSESESDSDSESRGSKLSKSVSIHNLPKPTWGGEQTLTLEQLALKRAAESNQNQGKSNKLQGKPLTGESKKIYESTYDNKTGKPTGKVAIPEDHGITINDYLYKGDKIFAYIENKNPERKLAIYTGDDNDYMTKPSNKSDHELVYMEINDTSGGKRKSYRGRKSKKQIKSYRGRKSKKQKKSNRKTKKRGKK